mmetsp:Transcript_39445/g.79663  ORF Transcript_39445/g.79663 Transcript_39445/m.79663 type:complete len:247 (-) Transcript_39445:317-1057(-)
MVLLRTENIEDGDRLWCLSEVCGALYDGVWCRVQTLNRRLRDYSSCCFLSLHGCGERHHQRLVLPSERNVGARKRRKDWENTAVVSRSLVWFPPADTALHLCAPLRIGSSFHGGCSCGCQNRENDGFACRHGGCAWVVHWREVQRRAADVQVGRHRRPHGGVQRGVHWGVRGWGLQARAVLGRGAAHPRPTRRRCRPLRQRVPHRQGDGAANPRFDSLRARARPQHHFHVRRAREGRALRLVGGRV